MTEEQKQSEQKKRTPKTKSAYSIALEKVQAEQPIQTEQEASQTANHSDIQKSKQPASQPVEQQNIQTGKQETMQTAKQQRTKATYYLRMEDLIAIDTMQTQRYKATGKKPEKSEIVSEAIKLLLSQSNS